MVSIGDVAKLVSTFRGNVSAHVEVQDISWMLDVVGPLEVDRQAAWAFRDADRGSRDGQVQLGPRDPAADLPDFLPPPSAGVPFQPGCPIGFDGPVDDEVE